MLRRAARLVPGDDGAVTSMELADGTALDVDVVVFATGIRPRDELARAAGLPVGTRGGVVVDEQCRVPVPDVFAVGEVACIAGRTWGLVGPGYTMAEVVVDQLLGGDGTFTGADTSTKLKLLGVDVASFGDAFAESPGALEVVYADPVARVYKKLVLSDDAQTLLGGVLVGDEWAATLSDPGKLSQFVSFLNRPEVADPTLAYIPERGQRRPATPAERAVLVADPSLEVRS